MDCCMDKNGEPCRPPTPMKILVVNFNLQPLVPPHVLAVGNPMGVWTSGLEGSAVWWLVSRDRVPTVKRRVIQNIERIDTQAAALILSHGKTGSGGRAVRYIRCRTSSVRGEVQLVVGSQS